MICQGTIAAHEHEDGTVSPARPCDAEATMLARSMYQEPHPDHGATWVKLSDEVYCPAHFVPGTMTHLDGTVTQHAAMSAADA